MDKRLKTVLEYATMAPSGDNCQPWKFKVDELNVELFNHPEKDTSLYNIKQRASLIAHGALLENIKVAGPSVGLQPDIELLPNPSDSNHIASIKFTECEKAEHPLFAAIPKRHTNREKYSPVKISDSQILNWQSLTETSENHIWATNDKDQIKQLANHLSYNDRLVFEVPELHRFLFEQIRWTDQEAEATGDGLDIKTLGLKTADKIAFKFLQNWKLVSVFNKLGFSRFIQFNAKQLLHSSSAVVIITIPEVGAINYVRGGMGWQRLLLQLTSEGLTSQPIAGLACLMQSNKEKLLNDKLSADQKSNLSETRDELIRIGSIASNQTILAMFRIGVGKEVTRALRKTPAIF